MWNKRISRRGSAATPRCTVVGFVASAAGPVVVSSSRGNGLFGQQVQSSSLCVCPYQSANNGAGATTVRRNTRVAMGLFGLGFPEIAVIAAVGALFFGPSKIAEWGKELGGVAGGVKKASAEFKEAMQESLEEADKEIERMKQDKQTQPTTTTTTASTPPPAAESTTPPTLSKEQVKVITQIDVATLISNPTTEVEVQVPEFPQNSEDLCRTVAQSYVNSVSTIRGIANRLGNVVIAPVVIKLLMYAYQYYSSYREALYQQ